jgi:hypothetical protein
METRAPVPMLPALPTPSPNGPSHRPFRRFDLSDGLGRLLGAVLLCSALLLPLGLTSCGLGSQPPRSVLLDALALQIQLTQEQVARALDLEASGQPQVSRVRVEQQEAIHIGEAGGLHLQGRFDWRLAQDPIRVDSHFDLYLQRGERDESWRLARPVGSSDGQRQDWITDPLPLPGERRFNPLG